jgi:hypothetical protein
MCHIAMLEGTGDGDDTTLARAGHRRAVHRRQRHIRHTVRTWTPDELATLDRIDEVQLAVHRPDGQPGQSVTIWVVRHADHAYIRAYRGPGASWYQVARQSQSGTLTVGTLNKNVTLCPNSPPQQGADAVEDPALEDAVDAGYRTKYRRNGAGLIAAMTSSDVRATHPAPRPHLCGRRSGRLKIRVSSAQDGRP